MTVLQGKCLDLGTAQQLMAASKLVDWTELEPILLRMAQSVIELHDPLSRCTAMTKAALWLLGLLLAISAAQHVLCIYCRIILLCHQMSLYRTCSML